MDLPNKQAPPPEPQKKVIVQVVEDGVVTKAPRSMGRKFLDYAIVDSPKDMMKRVARETLGPQIKSAVEQGFMNFVHGLLWGNGQPPMSNIVKGTMLRGGGINYNQVSTLSALQQVQGQQAAPIGSTRSSGTYEDLVCPTQQVAEALLANMYELFNQYRVVAVGDLYEMAGITPSPADNNFGWLSLDGSKITQDRNGFVLSLPRPTRI